MPSYRRKEPIHEYGTHLLTNSTAVMKKFLVFCALSLAMLTASAADYGQPLPFTDTGVSVSMEQDSYSPDMQVYAYVCYNASEALTIITPALTDISVEYIRVIYVTGDTPLREVILYACAEPPDYSTVSMNGFAAPYANNKYRRRC